MKKIGILCVLLAIWGNSVAQTRLDSIRTRLFDPNDKKTLVAAHRGDWRNACENSLEAIENAIRMGVDIVEVDLQRTKDGELILMHDRKLDRTTTGHGLVADWTLDSLRTLRLKNGCSIRTICRIPTLKEALLLAKGRVMLNLDKAFDYFDQVYALLESTGTTNLVIMKSDMPADEVKSRYGKYLDKVIFMPKVNLDKPDAWLKLNDYLRELCPAAIEFKFASDTNQLPLRVKKAMQGRSRIWYNTLWDTHAGGHDDDRSLVDADAGYGYLIDSLGAGIIQTDRPAYLIAYLNARPDRMSLANDPAIIYRDGPSEYIPEKSENFQIVESFLKGKKNAASNEDGIIVTSDFAAVIDGATAKSNYRHNGKSTGRIAMELIRKAIRKLPSEIDAEGAMKFITREIHDFYVRHGLLDDLEENPAMRFTANGVIYSAARKEVWQIGDCQCRIGNLYSKNEKEIDGIMAEARAAMNDIALLEGLSLNDIKEKDPGRTFIEPFLRKQAVLQNYPSPFQRFGFPVFDGFPIDMKKVHVFPVGDVTEIILSSDGYPLLFSTLLQSEAYLKRILDEDPLCFRIYKSTKGIRAENVSFDDRAYLKIRLSR